MKTYRSKIDLWLMFLVFGITGALLIEGIIEQDWTALEILAVIIAFNAYLMSGIRYVIDGDVLMIKAGLMGTTKIPISVIKSVEKTHNTLSAPALSLKRLEIRYGKYDFALVSPKDRDAFIKDLLKINPDIQVKF